MFRYKRSDRVKELLREEISRYVQNIPNPDMGFITITEVKLSDDLNHARLYASVFGDDEQKKKNIAILKEHIHPIRKLLGKKLTMRRIPEIELVLDETSEKASKIFGLLNQINAEKNDSPDTNSNEQSST